MRVQVLLSAYNGEEFISDQIESIMAQSYPDVSLLIRDDGSEDETLKYIRELEEKYKGRIHYFAGENQGVKRSFFELLRASDPHASFYSFCDQDDIWLEDKLSNAVSALKNEKQNKPFLYFTSTMLTDEDLTEIKVWPDLSNASPSFYNAIAENIVVGTTAIINHSARDLLLKKDDEFENVIMHDWWVYLCISAFGEIVYDKNPSVLYRQHQANLIGGNKNLIELLSRKRKSFSENKGKRILYKQAEEFMRCYGDNLSVEKKEQIEMFLAPRNSLRVRLKYIRKSKLYRHSLLENMLLKFLILRGYI